MSKKGNQATGRNTKAFVHEELRPAVPKPFANEIYAFMHRDDQEAATQPLDVEKISVAAENKEEPASPVTVSETAAELPLDERRQHSTPDEPFQEPSVTVPAAPVETESLADATGEAPAPIESPTRLEPAAALELTNAAEPVVEAQSAERPTAQAQSPAGQPAMEAMAVETVEPVVERQPEADLTAAAEPARKAGKGTLAVRSTGRKSTGSRSNGSLSQADGGQQKMKPGLPVESRSPALSPAQSDLAEEIKQLLGTIETLQGEAAQAKLAIQAAQQVVQELEQLKQSLAAADKRSASLNQTIEELKRAVNNRNKKIDDLSAEVEKKNAELAGQMTEQARLNVLIEQANAVQKGLVEQIEQLKREKNELDARYKAEAACTFGPALHIAADLAEKGPSVTLGLKPLRVFNVAMDCMEAALGGRPVPFPDKSRCEKDEAGQINLWLDADQDGLTELLRRYDWSVEKPFEGRAEGQRRRKFRLLRWGYQHNDTVICKAVVTVLDGE